MSFARKLASQTALYGLGSIVGRGIYLLMTPLLTAKYNPEVYGLFSYCYSYVAFVLVILTFGMETAFFRFSDEASAKTAYAQSFNWVLWITVVFSGITLLLYKPIAQWVHLEAQPHLVWMSVLIMLFDALAALPMARLRQEEKPLMFTALSLGNTLLLLLLNIVFVVVLKKSIEWVFIANIIASAAKFFAVLPKTLPSTWKPDFQWLRPMVGYGFFIMLAGAAGMMNEHLDKLLLPNLWHDGDLYQGTARNGQEMLGIYAACYKMSVFIALLTQAFRYAAEPFFFKEAHKDDSPQKFAQVFHYFMLMCLAGFLLVGSFTHEIVAFDFFGIGHFIAPAYWSGLETVPILLVAYVCSAAYINLSIWFKITKQTRFALLFTGIGALITVLFNVLLIPSMGYMACAWATLLCYAVMAVLVYSFGQKYYPIPYRMKHLLLYAAICGVAYYANTRIGNTDGQWWIFGFKLLVSALAGGCILLIERLAPRFT